MNSILSCHSATSVTLKMKNFVTYLTCMSVAILHIHAFLVILFLFKTQTKIPYIELLYEFYFLM